LILHDAIHQGVTLISLCRWRAEVAAAEAEGREELASMHTDFESFRTQASSVTQLAQSIERVQAKNKSTLEKVQAQQAQYVAVCPALNVLNKQP
jgi:hypothetical protein